MLKTIHFSAKGTKKEDFSLPKDYDLKPNELTIAHVVRVIEDGLHPGNSKVKTRGEITASTRKIYRQKGTGGARHGAKSAPIFVGGGVAHGPKGVKRKLKYSRKVGKLALLSALSLKAKAKEVVVVSSLSDIKKTKDAKELVAKILKSLEIKKESPKILLATGDNYSNVVLPFRNIKNLDVSLFDQLNAFQIVNYNLILIDSEVFETQKDKKK